MAFSQGEGSIGIGVFIGEYDIVTWDPKISTIFYKLLFFHTLSAVTDWEFSTCLLRLSSSLLVVSLILRCEISSVSSFSDVCKAEFSASNFITWFLRSLHLPLSYSRSLCTWVWFCILDLRQWKKDIFTEQGRVIWGLFQKSFSWKLRLKLILLFYIFKGYFFIKTTIHRHLPKAMWHTSFHT